MHANRIAEIDVVPREVFLFVGVFDVEPDYINREIVVVQFGDYVLYVFVGVVVPAALVVTESPVLKVWEFCLKTMWLCERLLCS